MAVHLTTSTMMLAKRQHVLVNVGVVLDRLLQMQMNLPCLLNLSLVITRRAVRRWCRRGVGTTNYWLWVL